MKNLEKSGVLLLHRLTHKIINKNTTTNTSIKINGKQVNNNATTNTSLRKNGKQVNNNRTTNTSMKKKLKASKQKYISIKNGKYGNNTTKQTPA